MAIKVDTSYKCGCGFSTRDIDKAVAHCKGTGHTLFTQGTISPEKEPKVAKPQKTRVVSEEPATVGEFANLRKKLTGG